VRSSPALRESIAAGLAVTTLPSLSFPSRLCRQLHEAHNCETPLIGGDVSYRPDPVEPPADGNALICCSRPQGDIVIDL
jgi:hypothetical protein